MPNDNLYSYLDDHGQLAYEQGETWRWKAMYDNGQSLRQFNEDNRRFHRLREIDQSRLSRFVIYSLENDHTITMPFDPSDMKLIYLYRRGVCHVPCSGGEEVYSHQFVFYVFGYEKHGDDGKNIKQLYTVDVYGNVYLHDNTPFLAEQEARREAAKMTA